MTDLATNETTTNVEPNIIRIPKYNLYKLEEKMKKLNKKANKIGCPELSYKILDEYSVKHPDYVDPDNHWVTHEDRIPHITMVALEIIGQGPKIEGWKFLGTFDHVTLPGAVIVNAVPGETIPTEYHNCEPICEHCGTKRRRNETFLLQEIETGDYKLIGRQCVKDFIGYDAKHIFNYLKMIRTFEDDFVEEDLFWGGYGGQQIDNFNSDEVLAVTACIIHKYGWMSRSKADFDDRPTADEVVYFFYPPKHGTREYELWLKWKGELDAENPKWKKEAEAARVWLKEQPDDNEYMHNLHVIDGTPVNHVPVKLFGYWCSLVSSYQRAMEKLREREKTLRVNEHVGTVKQRRNFNVKLIKHRSFEGYYGYVYLHIFLDDEGHTLVWKASREQDFHVGDNYTITATVKKHDDYNDWAQTIITRVKDITPAKEEAA